MEMVTFFFLMTLCSLWMLVLVLGSPGLSLQASAYAASACLSLPRRCNNAPRLRWAPASIGLNSTVLR